MIGFGKPSPYQLALHWTQDQLYLLLAKRRRGSQSLEWIAARSVAVDTSSAEALSQSVAVFLEEFQATRPQTFVALSRSQIDVFHVDLPTATDQELVSLVQMYMLQNEPDLVDSAIIDFVRVRSETDQSRVLAYAAMNATLEFVANVVNPFGGNLMKVGVRGLASFGLLPPDSPTGPITP